jgi:HK97 gp10 family phage protein
MQKMEAVTVGNLDIVVKKLKNMQDLDFKPILSKSARIVKKTAKKIAPFDTGDLVRGMRHEVFDDHAIVYNKVEYAIYQEYGTYKMKGKPFLRPALRGNRNYIVKLFKDYIRSKTQNVNTTKS